MLIEIVVRAIYLYDAQGDDEISFTEGELIKLTSGPTGGQHYGDGWWEGKYICSLFVVAVNVCRYRIFIKRQEGNISKQLCKVFLDRLVDTKLISWLGRWKCCDGRISSTWLYLSCLCNT